MNELFDIDGKRVNSLEHVILWQNATVMVFGDSGKQVPELQGVYWEVKTKVLEHAGPGTTFYHGEWRESCQRVDRELW